MCSLWQFNNTCKKQFWLCFFNLFGIVYLIYYAIKKADICPVCKKKAYK